MFAQFKYLTWKASLIATVMGLLGFTIALAASGDLDTTFDGDGRVTSFVVPSDPGRSDQIEGIAIQPDGKIIVAGNSFVSSPSNSDFALVRFNSNGSLDTTFSGDGRLLTNFGNLDYAFDVALQSNGKIVAAGQKCVSGLCDVAIARYNPNGTLDVTFSGDGKQISDFGGRNNGSFGGLAIQSNGKIVVAGYLHKGTDTDFAVYRYLPDGTLDTAFSGDGRVNFGFGAGRQDVAQDLVIQGDGKILVAGYSGDASSSNKNFAIARLNANGSLDTTFSGDGRNMTNFGGEDLGMGIALQPNGKILVAGEQSTGDLIALARYNPNGNLDATFNGTGRKSFAMIAGKPSSGRDVVVQSDGKIVVIGFVGADTSIDFALARLNSSGSFDTTFSGNGKVTVDFAGGDDFGLGLAVQPSDGRYVLAGYTIDSAFQSDFALARVLP
jgi:uncharacterized delta-60 repeat protein